MNTDAKESLNWPLMNNNITTKDKESLISFLKEDRFLTQSEQVRLFEKEWSEWLGVKHSVFVNSGSSANLITMVALKEKYGEGEVIVPPLTWSSDISSILYAGLTPVFVDIDPSTLGMNTDDVLSKISSKTRGVFITHILGYNAVDEQLIEKLDDLGLPLIEDCCESHGATFKNKKVGAVGFASNFSFYFAHHLSTVEGGMVCTDDSEFYEMIRMLRSHGLVREIEDEHLREKYIHANHELNPQFIFELPGFNVRSTEMNAVLGRNQLKRLDDEIVVRNANLKLFLKSLDPEKYRVNFKVEGCSNYALTLILNEKFKDRIDDVVTILKHCGVEYRRGLSGGGQPVETALSSQTIYGSL
jgi:CDP-6-deoxy-D-xylo-4-hexulose-3-dehydrase